MMTKKDKLIASYSEPFRVIYKQTGKPPVVRIIRNVPKLKKMIINGTLKMIRYESYIIICFRSLQNIGVIPNIVMNIKNVAGDFLFVGFDSKIKDFRGLTLIEIDHYVKELSRKSFNLYQYKKFLEKNINREKKNKKFSKKIKNEIQIEENKITIKPIGDNELIEPKVAELKKNNYEFLCTKFGLDSTRGQLVIEKSSDDSTNQDIQIDWDKNIIILPPESFDELKKMNEIEKENSKDEIDKNITVEKIESEKDKKQDSLELILRIQNDILNYIKNSTNEENDD